MFTVLHVCQTETILIKSRERGFFFQNSHPDQRPRLITAKNDPNKLLTRTSNHFNQTNPSRAACGHCCRQTRQDKTDRQTDRESFVWSTRHVTQIHLPGNSPTFNHQTHTKDTDEEGFPLVLTEFVQTNGLQEERLRLVLFVRRAAFQFVVVNATILPDTVAFYTETKTTEII